MIILLGSWQLMAQDFEEIILLKDAFMPASRQTDYHKSISNKNEFQQLAGFAFLFYKRFIASQDIDACVFEPSCSVYAIGMIKKRGLLIGLMAAADRLTRCNRFSPEEYKVDSKNGLFVDAY